MKSNIDLRFLLDIPSEKFEKFHNLTKIKWWPKSSHSLGLPLIKRKKIYFKGYSRLNEILLPLPVLPKKNFQDIMESRKSSRSFSKSTLLSLKTLGSIIFYSAGIKKGSNDFGKRFYPSAGALYPLEIYLISTSTKLPNGVYHYYLKNHSLEQLFLFDRFDYQKYFNQGWMEKSSCLLVITAVFKRTTKTYGDRGYRHIIIETGHLGQNIYLCCAAFGIDCCAVGGYIDNNLNEFLDVDGINEGVVYVLALGMAD